MATDTLPELLLLLLLRALRHSSCDTILRLLSVHYYLLAAVLRACDAYTELSVLPALRPSHGPAHHPQRATHSLCT